MPRLSGKCYAIKKIYVKLISCGVFAQVFTLGLLQIHIAFVASKAVADQETAESQVSGSHVAQQRIGDYDYGTPTVADDSLVGHDDHHHPHDDHHHHHHDDHHDPGFWKKKVIWKEGWKKYWVDCWRFLNFRNFSHVVQFHRNPEKNKYGLKVHNLKVKQKFRFDFFTRKPDVKKVWKPIWVPTQIPVWKDISVSLQNFINA